MFENLSPKGKRMVLNGIIVSAIMLFIIGFFIGKSDEEKKEVNSEETEETNTDVGLSYSDLHSPIKENEEHMEVSETQTEEEQPMHEQYEHENPEIDFDENAEVEINILEDFFSKEEIDKAKEVSESFIKAFYTFNGDTPTKHIDEALKFVSDSLSEELKGEIVRPTYNYYSRNFTEIFVYEPYNPKEEEMNIRVRVEGEVFNSDGEQTRTETLDYDLKLIPYEDTFKINEYSFITYR